MCLCFIESDLVVDFRYYFLFTFKYSVGSGFREVLSIPNGIVFCRQMASFRSYKKISRTKGTFEICSAFVDAFEKDKNRDSIFSF